MELNTFSCSSSGTKDFFRFTDTVLDLVNILDVGDFILATATDASVLLVVTKSESGEVDTGYVAVA